MRDRSLFQYIIIGLKGMAMGAADVVPGVSGGTIAFISGIYEELITSLNNVNWGVIKTWRAKGFKAAWASLNGNFLLALFIGILISVLSLAKIISWLLENHPVLLWSFFFGLVLASVFFVAKDIGRWNVGTVFIFIAGAILAWVITSLPPSGSSDSLFFLFISGALAICAMILPGISGAFILVLLGSYKTVLDAVHQKDLLIIASVSIGAVFGLLSFARILKWMFNNYKNITLALLTGFILGSLNKIWPWKMTLESRVIGDKTVVLRESNISPFAYEGDPQLLYSIILAVLGFSVIFTLEKLAVKK